MPKVEAFNAFFFSTGGMHGWNSSSDMMKTIFLASGPAFKKGYVKKGFENIHVYELMCAVLGLTPAANNGSFSAVADLLLSSSGKAGSDEHTTIFTGAKVLAVGCPHFL